MNEQQYHEQLVSRFKPLGSERKSIRIHMAYVLQALRRRVPDRSAHILDVGCHEGVGLSLLRRWGYTNVEGVEYLDNLVQVAKKKKCKVQRGDAHYLTFKNSEFDVVFSRYLLEHCHTPVQVIKEMVRVLKPGGVLFIEVSCDPDNITDKGLVVFRNIEDLRVMLPDDMVIESLNIVSTKLKWADIRIVGTKTKGV